MPWAAFANTPGLSAGLDGVLYRQNGNHIEVWTPEVSQQQCDGVYSTPVAELSTFHVDASQRVPHDHEADRPMVDRPTDEGTCTHGDTA